MRGADSLPLWIALVFACGSPDVVVGGETPPPMNALPADSLIDGVVGSSFSPLDLPTPSIAGADADSAWIGAWVGELDSGSVRDVELDLDFRGGEANGAIRFGGGLPPARATDGTAGYPAPDADRVSPGLHHHQVPAPGFIYSIVAGRMSDTSVELSFSLNELWSVWCTLQSETYFDDVTRQFTCVPADAVMETDGRCFAAASDAAEELDCDRLELCRGAVCSCWLGGCIADLRVVDTLTLFLEPDGETATGSTSAGGSLRMTRMR